MSQGGKHKTSGRVTTRGSLRRGASETQISLAGCVPAEPGSVSLGSGILQGSDSPWQQVRGTQPIPGMWRDDRVRRPCAERSLTGLHFRDLLPARCRARRFEQPVRGAILSRARRNF